MASVIPGFEYDIFISYRHNDRKWMDEFMPELKEALIARFGNNKLNIFYDENTNDGLGATHEVRASLDHRVANSVILIALISATYCQTDMYSWQYEFLPFLEHAKRSQLGLKLFLPSGSAEVSRVLTLRTYNLEAEHTQLLHQTLEGFMRSVDFVYEAKDVNRPLQVKDDDSAFPTTNNLLYRNQLSTLVGAIKERIDAAKAKAATLGISPVVAIPVVVAPVVAIPVVAAPVVAAPVVAAPVVAAPVVAAPVVAAPVVVGPKVFLAWTAPNLKARREHLAQICTSAGLNVVNVNDCPGTENDFRDQTQKGLAEADCSLHLLGNKFGDRLNDDDECSYSMYAYNQARLQAGRKPAFRQFVWYAPDTDAKVDKDQEAFVSQIRNELTAQCTLSSAPDGPQLIQELRTALVPPPPPASTAKETDICFISNALDAKEADAIMDQLCEDYGYNLDQFSIAPNGEEKYKEKTVHAISRSRLAVVYFKHSVDWALPFVKQVYQLVGGADSPTPILYLGEDDPEENGVQKVRAKNLKSSILPRKSLGEEVQRVFQQANSTPA